MQGPSTAADGQSPSSFVALLKDIILDPTTDVSAEAQELVEPQAYGGSWEDSNDRHCQYDLGWGRDSVRRAKNG